MSLAKRIMDVQKKKFPKYRLNIAPNLIFEQYSTRTIRK